MITNDNAILEVRSRVNNRRVYIENVRSILNITHSEAVHICETAVEQGLLGTMQFQLLHHSKQYTRSGNSFSDATKI